MQIEAALEPVGHRVALLEIAVEDHSVDRRDGPLEDVVDTPVFAGALDGHKVSRLLHDADGRGVALGVGADRAQVVLGEVEAPVAEADGTYDLDITLTCSAGGCGC